MEDDNQKLESTFHINNIFCFTETHKNGRKKAHP